MGFSYRTVNDKCPLCGNRIYWTCRGNTGSAHCSKSLYATRDLSDRSFCTWSGKVVRKSDGQIYFIVEV